MTEPNAPFAPDWASPPGDTIVDLIEERGWTQAELAERLGYSARHVSRLVQGRGSADRGRRVAARTHDGRQCRFLADAGGPLP